MLKKLFIIAFFVLNAARGFAANSAAANSAELVIRFYDRQAYYLASEPVFVQVSVSNTGASPYRFRLADERAFSLDFDVRTLQNRAVAEADALLRKRTENRHVYYRDVTVEPGESFSFVEDLRSFAALGTAGAYIIQAKLYSETYKAAGAEALLSNRLQLSLRPPAITGPDGAVVMLNEETKANLVRDKLPPDEVVAWTLEARQKSQWEKFFLYVDMESMLSRDGPRQRQWRAESEEGRARMLARYKADLQAEVVDGDIAMIPSAFTIERTSYNAENAEVAVIELFRGGGGNFTERRRYTYYLRREGGVWSIIDYMVINLGTE
jgi:hypothetical protein